VECIHSDDDRLMFQIWTCARCEPYGGKERLAEITHAERDCEEIVNRGGNQRARGSKMTASDRLEDPDCARRECGKAKGHVLPVNHHQNEIYKTSIG